MRMAVARGQPAAGSRTVWQVAGGGWVAEGSSPSRPISCTFPTAHHDGKRSRGTQFTGITSKIDKLTSNYYSLSAVIALS